MRYINFRRKRIDYVRWIAHKISDIGYDIPWIKGIGKIKKEALSFTAKFW